MGSWSVEFQLGAERDLAGLAKEERRHIIDKLYWLVENCDTVHHRALSGEWSDFYKLRVGDLRVKYFIEKTKENIVVAYIDRRDKAYKKRK